MNSLDNLYFMSTFNDDSWLSQRYNDVTLTTSLENAFHDDPFSSLSDMVRPESTTSTFTSPSVSGSDHDTPIQKRNHEVINKKITKRKSKKNTTTFVKADVNSFRQLVQKLTGVSGKFGVAKVVKPEPKRVGDQVHGCSPTLDTSSFLVDYYQELVADTPTTVMGQQSYIPAERGGGFNSESFPTLESWVGL